MKPQYIYTLGGVVIGLILGIFLAISFGLTGPSASTLGDSFGTTSFPPPYPVSTGADLGFYDSPSDNTQQGLREICLAKNKRKKELEAFINAAPAKMAEYQKKIDEAVKEGDVAKRTKYELLLADLTARVRAAQAERDEIDRFIQANNCSQYF